MTIVTGDRYLEKLVKFVEAEAGPLIEGTLVLKLNPVGLHYVHSRLESLSELENLLAGAPVDYLRAYVSDLGDHRALEQLRRILRLLPSLKVVSVLPLPARDPTPLSLLPFVRLRVLELRGCDLSTSAARGLLELRHTLEKIVCHNSTDALRHIFASRIVEIKDSPQWNRLSFVSCACNGLVLMDESLQLLSAVETLDLSRNKFAKVDNLRKCTKLKHLDLGFNQLRTIAPFGEVSSNIVKLVLRNNALTTLRGVENLKLLEGLDVSYNIISNVSELEILSGLPSMKRLWLEGNPLCCARWYRAQVFSFFSHPDKLKLDDKEISTREFWQMQIIIASRQKRPSSFGFYSPAKEDAEEGSINRKRKKVYRLASIQSEEESTHICSDQESASCDNEIQSREENVVSDEEAEIVDLINRVELMKKERSVLWLREFREWMEEASENSVARNKHTGATLRPGKENYLKTNRIQRHLGESSKLVSDSVQASEDELTANILESENSFADTSTASPAHQHYNHIDSSRNASEISLPGMRGMDFRHEHLKSDLHERLSLVSVLAENSHPNTITVEGSGRIVKSVGNPPYTAIDGVNCMMGSQSSSTFPGSPPHYQEDILQRRHNLVEEILQLSADSHSLASSDSNTSCSEDDLPEFGPSMYEVDQSVKDQFSYRNVDELSLITLPRDRNYDQGSGFPLVRENGNCSDPTVAHDGELTHLSDKQGDWLGNEKSKMKPKRRVIPLEEENYMIKKLGTLQKPKRDMDVCGYHGEDKQIRHNFDGSDLQEVIDEKQTWGNSVMTPLTDDANMILPRASCSSVGIDSMFENYFNINVADSSIHETCRHYVRCGCILEQDFRFREREVILVLSSEHRLYVLLVTVAVDGSGCFISLLGCHMVDDVREVLVGLGLQVVRVRIERGTAYLFLTRNIQKSRELLHTLDASGSNTTAHKYSIRSLEQVQVDLFEKQICGFSKVSIFQYSMVLFWCNRSEEESWLPRSLFVIRGHVFVCTEDLMHFSSLSMDTSCSPYFSLDSCCSVTDMTEMVIETKGSQCVTLSLDRTTSYFCPSKAEGGEVAENDKERAVSGTLKWKLKWFSEESLLKFVTLLKAIHEETTTCPLLIRCIS